MRAVVSGDDVQVVEHQVARLAHAKRPVAGMLDRKPAKHDVRGIVDRDAVHAAILLLVRGVVAVAAVQHAALFADNRHVDRVVDPDHRVVPVAAVGVGNADDALVVVLVLHGPRRARIEQVLRARRLQPVAREDSVARAVARALQHGPALEVERRAAAETQPAHVVRAGRERHRAAARLEAGVERRLDRGRRVRAVRRRRHGEVASAHGRLARGRHCHADLRLGRDGLARADIRLGEAPKEDFAVAAAVVVPHRVDRAVLPEGEVGIGGARARIEEQAALPGLAFVVRDVRRQVLPSLVGVRLVAVLDEEQIAACEARHRAARGRVGERALDDGRPRVAAVRRERLLRALVRADPAVDGAVLHEHDAMLVEGLSLLGRDRRAAAPRERPAAVLRDEQSRALFGPPDGDGEHPLALRSDDGLAHHHARADLTRRGVRRARRLRRVEREHHQPVAQREVAVVGAGEASVVPLPVGRRLRHRHGTLGPGNLQLAVGRDPHLGVEGAHGAAAVGIVHEHFLPRVAVVLARRDHQVVVGVLAGRDAPVPHRPETPRGRIARHRGDSLMLTRRVCVCRVRRAQVVRVRRHHQRQGRTKYEQIEYLHSLGPFFTRC